MSEKTIRRKVDTGEIRHKRVGKLIRIPASEIDDDSERIPQEA
ncbi:MAG: excisionase family DNA-binding protein [Candidatus Latescibacterota bacterium]